MSTRASSRQAGRWRLRIELDGDCGDDPDGAEDHRAGHSEPPGPSRPQPAGDQHEERHERQDDVPGDDLVGSGQCQEQDEQERDEAEAAGEQRTAPLHRIGPADEEEDRQQERTGSGQLQPCPGRRASAEHELRSDLCQPPVEREAGDPDRVGPLTDGERQQREADRRHPDHRQPHPAIATVDPEQPGRLGGHGESAEVVGGERERRRGRTRQRRAGRWAALAAGRRRVSRASPGAPAPRRSAPPASTR